MPSAPTSQQTTQPSERKQIAAILARLALHFWRPDFTPEQARMVIEDYLDDLRGYSPTQIERACMQFRKRPDSTFFPKSGQLLGILGADRELDPPRSRLPTWRAPAALMAPRGKLKTVAEVLRDSGHTVAADRWEWRHEK